MDLFFPGGKGGPVLFYFIYSFWSSGSTGQALGLRRKPRKSGTSTRPEAKILGDAPGKRENEEKQRTKRAEKYFWGSGESRDFLENQPFIFPRFNFPWGEMNSNVQKCI